MISRYSELRSQLNNEYREAYDYIYHYAIDHMVVENVANEALMSTLDLFLTAQNKNQHLHEIINTDLENYCKNYFNQEENNLFNSLKDYMFLFTFCIVFSGMTFSDVSSVHLVNFISYIMISLITLLYCVLVRFEKMKAINNYFMFIIQVIVYKGLFLILNQYSFIKIRYLNAMFPVIIYGVYILCEKYSNKNKVNYYQNQYNDYSKEYIASLIKSRDETFNREREAKGLLPLSHEEIIKEKKKRNSKRFVLVLLVLMGVFAFWDYLIASNTKQYMDYGTNFMGVWLSLLAIFMYYQEQSFFRTILLIICLLSIPVLWFGMTISTLLIEVSMFILILIIKYFPPEYLYLGFSCIWSGNLIYDYYRHNIIGEELVIPGIVIAGCIILFIVKRWKKAH